MPGKARPSLRAKTLYNVERSNLNRTDKECIKAVFERYEDVKHGEWIWKHRHRGGFETRTGYDELGYPHTITIDNRYEIDDPYCSVCGKLGGDFLNYCGNCGAKMNGTPEN